MATDNYIIKQGDTASKATSDGNGNNIADTYVPYKVSPRYYPLLKHAYASGWYKITLPYNGYTSTGSAWFMNSFEISFGGPYEGAPSGSLYLAWYVLKDSSNVYSLSNAAATVVGTFLNSYPKIYHEIGNPAIIYLQFPHHYNGIAVKDCWAHDTAQSFDFLNTTVVGCSAPTNITQMTIAKYYSHNN